MQVLYRLHLSEFMIRLETKALIKLKITSISTNHQWVYLTIFKHNLSVVRIERIFFNLFTKIGKLICLKKVPLQKSLLC